ncbi:hypothetical protein PNBC_13805 [Paenibacillus crassostreae]|uniref:NodB homology domain-containing protein n=1 Tax=Paenibacillus crassostreae TaxID=1763538 RepID=A0A167CUH7_9BACL|nr:hypothetical protein LPB68_16075 [Paenibacillus crassostreae]OAB73586.1 hypothetical protein PNBC_13805 [Paenibacillus crassostreae]
MTQKTVYLTFDDGPSKLTGQVLDILKEANVKGTFFVLGQQVHQYPELLTRTLEEGHAVGNHTYNHSYDELYKEFFPFWNQIKQTEDEINLITGFRPSLVRAPGGTAGHFDDTYFSLLKQGGYQVIDWNVDSGDSKRRSVPAQEIIKNATLEIQTDEVIVLMHDGGGHEETIKALPTIIKFYQDKGYKFDVLSSEQEPVQFKVSKSAQTLNRHQPSQSWIATHVIPNAALFAEGKRLVLEVGRMETSLEHGEYMITEDKIMVPLRITMDKLGVQVKWDAKNKQVMIQKGLETLQIHVSTGEWTVLNRKTNGLIVSRNVPMQLRGDTLWVPLRELLQETGHKDISISMNEEEWRVSTREATKIYLNQNL